MFNVIKSARNCAGCHSLGAHLSPYKHEFFSTKGQKVASWLPCASRQLPRGTTAWTGHPQLDKLPRPDPSPGKEPHPAPRLLFRTLVHVKIFHLFRGF